MIRKIQCFVMALCLLLTAAFGLGVPMTVSAAETDDFEIMYELCYEQTIGAKPGEALDTSNEYVAAFVQNVDKTANENWAIMNKSDDTDRTEIFQGIKPEVGVRPNRRREPRCTRMSRFRKKSAADYGRPARQDFRREI